MTQDTLETYEEVIARVEREYPPVILKEMVRAEIERTLKKVRQYREREYALNDERRAKGIPYPERMALFRQARVDFCNEYEARLAAVRTFRVRPVREWIREDDIWWMSRYGIEGIIRLNLERVYELL